ASTVTFTIIYFVLILFHRYTENYGEYPFFRWFGINLIRNFINWMISNRRNSLPVNPIPGHWNLLRFQLKFGHIIFAGRYRGFPYATVYFGIFRNGNAYIHSLLVLRCYLGVIVMDDNGFRMVFK